MHLLVLKDIDILRIAIWNLRMVIRKPDTTILFPGF
jgi:hypothetical protein